MCSLAGPDSAYAEAFIQADNFARQLLFNTGQIRGADLTRFKLVAHPLNFINIALLHGEKLPVLTLSLGFNTKAPLMNE